MPSKNIFWFKDIVAEDINAVGEKSVRLAELKKEGINIPEGFVITSHAFDEFIKENQLSKKARHLMMTANHENPHSITQISNHIKKYFNEGDLNSEFKLELYNAYKKLGGKLTDVHVKILLSPVSEAHLYKHDHSWNEVKGEASLIHSVKMCWSSNFSEINLINNHDDSSYTKSLIVQRIINPDKSGKIYTIDPENYDKSKAIIKNMLGEYSEQTNLVTMPDIYEVDKSDHKVKSSEIVNQMKMRKIKNGIGKVMNVTKTHKSKKILTEKEIDQLLKQSKQVEKFTYFPQEIDYAFENNRLYFINIRPLTHIV